MRLDLMYALNTLNGDYSYRQTAEAWETWLASDEGQNFVVDPERSQAYRNANDLFDNQVTTLGDFYGVGIYSDRLVFVLDSSKSMDKDGKMEDLRANTVMTLESFPRHVRYNMVDFGGSITVLYPGGLIGDTQMGIHGPKQCQVRAATMPLNGVPSLMK